MSEAFITRRGGGGGLSPNNAVIHVTAPAGSAISFAKGSIVAKVLGPEKSHVNADDTSMADWYYPISSSNYGTWTVTATLGINSESVTVTVDANKQYDFTLRYGLLLIDNGKLLYPCSTYACTATEDTVNQVVTCAASAGYTKFWIQLTSSMLDGAYSSLVADIVYCGVQSYVGLEKPADRDLTGAGLASKWSSGAISSLTRLTVDISTLNPSLQNAFVKVGANAGTKTTASIKIKNLYLARRAV